VAKAVRPPDTFAALLAALLRREGLTAYALAQRSGVSKQALSKLLSGDSRPSWDTVVKLADALGVSTESFRPHAE
jgi:transcriptional regulator with XRE-family HTH domain